MRRLDWHDGQTDQLLKYYEKGYKREEIARLIGVTHWQVRTKCEELGLGRWRRPGLYTTGEVSTLFFQGIHEMVIRRWRAEGKLPAMRRGNHWWFKHEDLLVFLEDEERWMDWEPENIIDRGVRSWAEEMRAVSWRWLTMAEAGEILCVDPRQVASYIKSGLLPGVTHGIKQERAAGWRWWARSDHVQILADNPDLVPYSGCNGKHRERCIERAQRLIDQLDEGQEAA